MDLTPKWIEDLMTNHNAARMMARVLSVETEPAVGKGDNYSSDMERIKMQIVLGSGYATTKSLILKKHPPLTNQQVYLKEYHAYPIETLVYSEIIPKIERLMMDHKDTSEKLWCDCLDSQEFNYMFLEDLQDIGFRNADRVGLLDLTHALFTVRNLARLHAMSAILIQKKILEPKLLKPYCMARNKEQMNIFMSTGMKMLSKVMKQSWGREWDEAAEKISALAKDIGWKLEELWKADRTNLTVLNHGDCWINNIMFKYELGTNNPIGIRFVDLQEAHFNSYGWDLIFLFQTSLQLQVRERNMDEIISTYQHSLVSTFEFYKFVPDNVPSINEIKQELSRLFLYGFTISTVFLPVAMADAEDTMEIDKLILETDPDTIIHKTNMYSAPDYTDIAKREIKRFMHM